MYTCHLKTPHHSFPTNPSSCWASPLTRGLFLFTFVIVFSIAFPLVDYGLGIPCSNSHKWCGVYSASGTLDGDRLVLLFAAASDYLILLLGGGGTVLSGEGTSLGSPPPSAYVSSISCNHASHCDTTLFHFHIC